MSKRDPQRGAAVVEFAILIIPLIIFLFGIFEFGFLWLNSYYIANSAREGARVAAKISGSEAANTTARESAAEVVVKQYLAENLLFADKLSEKSFVVTSYADSSATVTVGGEDITIPLSEVTVTVQTAMVWEPVLWPLLNALTNSDYELREIRQTASFAIE